MIEYIPKTQTINTDRKYFVKNDLFIKIDEIAERGKNEAKILIELKNKSNYCQEYLNSYIENNKHILITKYFKSETLENLSIDTKNLKIIEQQLFEFFLDIQKNNIVHGDLNISNILFDGNNIKVIDWESSYVGDSILDLFGPPTPTNHCGIINIIKILRGKINEKQN